MWWSPPTQLYAMECAGPIWLLQGPKLNVDTPRQTKWLSRVLGYSFRPWQIQLLCVLELQRKIVPIFPSPKVQASILSVLLLLFSPRFSAIEPTFCSPCKCFILEMHFLFLSRAEITISWHAWPVHAQLKFYVYRQSKTAPNNEATLLQSLHAQ